MIQHETIYDYLAARFRQLGGKPITLDKLMMDAEQDGYGDIWEVDRIGVFNALRARGIELTEGVVKFPEIDGENFDPIATDYRDFKSAAKAVLDLAEYPVPTHDLIGRVALHSSAVPLSSLRYHLRQVGIHFLPGLGYWRHPQFTDAAGRTVSRKIRSERIVELLAMFEHKGWPITGREAEAWSNGLVTSRYLTLYARGLTPMVRPIGSGLYVPADKIEPENTRIPMSRNVVEALQAIDATKQIDDKDHLRLFRIVLLAERLGWAKVKRSRTTRDGIRRQTMRVTWTDEGAKQLRRAAKATADAF